MKIFNSLSFWGKLLFLVLLILLSFAFYKIIYPKKMEGFQESEKTVDTKTDSNVYDDFYV